MARDEVARRAWLVKWREKNRDKLRQWGRESYLRNRDKKLARDRAAYAADPEKRRAKTNRWRASNPGEAKEQFKRWCAANPDKVKVRDTNKRARRRKAEGKHTAEDIARIRKAQRDRCACCRSPLNGAGTVDHILAVANGGTNWPSNLQLMCILCNSAKQARDPIEFMQSRGLLL